MEKNLAARCWGVSFGGGWLKEALACSLLLGRAFWGTFWFCALDELDEEAAWLVLFEDDEAPVPYTQSVIILAWK